MRTLTALIAGALLLTSAAGTPVEAEGLVHVPIDADSVDGFDVFADPAPSQLLALDASGRFPLAAIPRGHGSGLDADTLDGKHLSQIIATVPTDLQCTACVGLGELGFDPATQAELESLAAAGTINDAANPLAWTRLKGVPPEFADGVDNTGGTATDLVCNLCVERHELADGAVNAGKLAAGSVGNIHLTDSIVTSSKILDGAVTVADLNFDPATQTELNALASSGTINTAANPVDWTKLKGVPAGLADGVDDVSSGPAADVVCAGCVDISDLGFDPATQAELDALGAQGSGIERPPFARVSLVTAGTAGQYNSVTIGSDGLPFVTYQDGINLDLKAVHCASVSCTARDAPVTLDSAGSVGHHTSVAVGSDGLPFITYWDAGNFDLKSVHCTNVSCSSRDAAISLDTVGNVGAYTSVTVGSDGFPFVTYSDGGFADLRGLHCTNVTCSAHDAPLVLDAAGSVGEWSSVTTGTDGFPFVSYLDNTNTDLKAVHCTNVSCTTRDAPLALDSFGGVGFYTSVTVGSDGFAFVSYYDALNTDLKAVHCTNLPCTTRDAPLVLDAVGNVGSYTSVTIGSDGFPFVSYHDFTNTDLKSLHCTNVSCTTRETPRSLDSAGTTGLYTSVTVGSDGYPFVTYLDGSPNMDLEAVHCSSQSCVPFQRRR